MPLCTFCRNQAVIGGETGDKDTPSLMAGQECSRCGISALSEAMEYDTH